MRIVPERSGAVQALCVIGGFVAGPLAAYRLSPVLSPESKLIAVIAPFAFGLVLFFGILSWVGFGLITVLWTGLAQMARGKGRMGQKMESNERLVPSGYLSFVVLGGLIGAVLGIAGAVLSDASMFIALGGWLGLGLAYGTGLWFAAHNGYLPFPEEE